MAALFIGVVMLAPNGLAGIWGTQIKPWLDRVKARRAERASLPALEATEPTLEAPEHKPREEGRHDAKVSHDHAAQPAN